MMKTPVLIVTLFFKEQVSMMMGHYETKILGRKRKFEKNGA